jgi:hypothetical protein
MKEGDLDIMESPHRYASFSHGSSRQTIFPRHATTPGFQARIKASVLTMASFGSAESAPIPGNARAGVGRAYALSSVLE